MRGRRRGLPAFLVAIAVAFLFLILLASSPVVHALCLVSRTPQRQQQRTCLQMAIKTAAGSTLDTDALITGVGPRTNQSNLRGWTL